MLSGNNLLMQSRTGKSSPSSGTIVLIVIVMIFTFPFWIGLLGGLFGLVVGLIGGAFGIVAGVFGAVIGGIFSVIGSIFHWGGGPWNFHLGFISVKLFMIISIIALVVYLSRRRR